MNKNNKIKVKNHRLFKLEKQFNKLETREEKKDFRAGLNPIDKKLLRILNNRKSLVIKKGLNKEKSNFESKTITVKGKKIEVEITPITRYKKLSNKIVDSIEELPTYNKSIELNPLALSCKGENCTFYKTCENKEKSFAFPITQSGVKRDQITDEIKFYSKIGLFRKFASNTPSLWRVEALDEIKKVYYITRKKGYSISYARQLAKLEGFSIGLKYSEVYKSIKSNYAKKENCTCSNCYFGRSYNCLNGEVKEYIPRYESLSDVKTRDSLNTLLLAEFVSTSKKLEAGQFIERIYNLCSDELDARIINLTLSGKKQIEVSSIINLEVSNIYLRLVKIGVKYSKQYKTRQ